MKNHHLSIIATVLLFTIATCKKEDDDHHHADAKPNSEYINNQDCTGSTPTYNVNVAPILDAKCATPGCHNAATASHGLNLEGYAAAKGNFNNHYTLCAINHGADCLPMPQGLPKLSDAEIKTITCWAKNNFPL